MSSSMSTWTITVWFAEERSDSSARMSRARAASWRVRLGRTPRVRDASNRAAITLSWINRSIRSWSAVSERLRRSASVCDKASA